MARVNTRAKSKCTIKASVCKGASKKKQNRNKINTMQKSMRRKSNSVENNNEKTWIFGEHNESAKKTQRILNAVCKDISKTHLRGKNGLISKKNKESLKYFDNILKSELLICDSDALSPPSKKSLNMSAPTDITGDNIQIMEICNGVSSPESLDSNSNRIRKTKNKVCKSPQIKPKTTQKMAKTKEIQDVNSRTKSAVEIPLNKLNPSLFQCDYCQKNFSAKSSLQRHVFIHMGIKRYSCKYCPKKFSQTSNLLAHTDRKHQKEICNSFVCNQCDKAFQQKENLYIHLQSHVKNENAYKCVFCDARFSHQVFLSQHEQQHLTSRQFQCSICQKSYKCRSRLAVHVKNHLNIKEYVCQFCGKEFLRANTVRRHVEICHGGVRIQCPICFKYLKGHLTEHLRTHENQKPHECPDCRQRFTQATQLTVHRRSHSGARPYPCKICKRPFRHSTALLVHIRRHTGEKPNQCPMCPMAFSQLPHMKAHLKKIHGKEAPYKCPKCDEFFKLKAMLENHVKSCTVGDRELTLEEKIQASIDALPEVESGMSLPRMRYLLALLLTMISTKERLKYLGFNKRLIDDLLIECLEAMGQTPCRDQSAPAIRRLKGNIQILLNGTVPTDQMQKFRAENKSTEELLELLTGENKP